MLFVVLRVPDFTVNLLVEKVFVLEFLEASSDFNLFFISLVFVKSRLFCFFTDSVTLFPENQLFPTIGDRSDFDLKIANFLVISRD